MIDFLDETIFKRQKVLNDLILKVYNKYCKYLAKNNEDIDVQNTLPYEKFYTITLDYPEQMILNKIIKHNIHILDSLISNVKIFENSKLYETIKDINIQLHEFVHFSEKKKGSNP